HAERCPPQDAEVCVRVPLAHAGLILSKRHVELPMQAVLDRPVAANGFGEPFRGDVLAENVIPHFETRLPMAYGVINGHADRLQFRPAMFVLKLFRHTAQTVVTNLFSPVPFLLGPVFSHWYAREVVPEV